MLPLIVFAASAADLPSFTCGPANSPTEAAICIDPELAAYDRAMTLAYPRMKATARASQRIWLTERNKCGDSKKCLRRSYVDRLMMKGGVFGTSGNPEAADVPTFLRGHPNEKSGLALLDVGGGEYVYHLWATFFSYTNNPHHPEELGGETFGVFKMNAGVGRAVAPRECDFTIKRHGNGWVISDAGDCLGRNVNPDGAYLPAPGKSGARARGRFPGVYRRG